MPAGSRGHFGTFEALRKTARAASRRPEARAEIDNIEGIGEVVAEAVADFFAEKHNEDELDALLEYVTHRADGGRRLRQPGGRQDGGLHRRRWST